MLRHRKLMFLAISLLVAITATISGQQQEEQRKQIDVTIRYGFDQWIMSPTVVDDPRSRNPGVTNAVFAHVLRAINPRTAQPYDLSEPEFAVDPEDVRHMFRLEKKEFILGEPILIEHRIELNGPGEWNWFIGGNYRARGRDDNFQFILRRLDGTIVPDVYPVTDGIYFGGGLGSDQTIKKDNPLSYWLGLQRYAAITEPGVYDLYCMTNSKVVYRGEPEAIRAQLPAEIARDHFVDDKGSLIDRTTGEVSLKYQIGITREYDSMSSPLSDLIPESSWSPGVVARFRVTIREGTKTEQQQMREYWTKAATKNDGELMGGYAGALSNAMWYAKQDHFLPMIEMSVKNYRDRNEVAPDGLHLEGLAMRSDTAAFKILLLASPPALVNAFYNLYSDRIAEAIPICIKLLSHENQKVRSVAENHLTRWTCQSFEREWIGYHWERPTLEEGKKMQPLWQAWWVANKDGFAPRNPGRSLCQEPE